MMTHSQKMLLKIIRRALWQENLSLEASAWDEVESLAEQQGVLWMLYPGTKGTVVPKEKLLEWRNAAITGIWQNESINALQKKLLAHLKDKRIRSVILKGTSCSRYYVAPNMRTLGDIDILVDRENIDAVADYLCTQGFEKMSTEHKFHIGFSNDAITVEVHYHCTDLPMGKGTDAARNAEKNFLDHIEIAEIDGMRFPVLSETHQALMLLMHMERHMQEDGIGLRQLCDWAAFVHGTDHQHWEQTIPLLKSCGLFLYAKVVMNACMTYLGLKCDDLAWANPVNTQLAEALMQDVFRRGNCGRADDQNVGSLFSDRSMMGKRQQGPLKGMLAKMTLLAYRKYPCSRRHKWLLPVLYFYIPVQYIIKSVLGKSARKDLGIAIANAGKRQRLYRMLHLYEAEK